MSFNRRIKRQMPRLRKPIRRQSMSSVERRRMTVKRPERRREDKKIVAASEKSNNLKMLSEL